MTQTMTAPQTLNVEYDELMMRADELEAPISGLPVDSPYPPSNLAHATGAAAQLAFSGDDMRRYIAAGQREWSRLAQSLRNAAKAYEEVDEGAAESIADETSMSVSAATLGVTDEDLDALMLTLTETPPLADPLPSYYPVREAAYDIAEPDQGVAFDGFAQEWTSYQALLVNATTRFRPFEYWDGDATYAVEANMEQHRDWLFTMASLCGKMADQASKVAAAQRWALPLHPTIEQVEKIDYYWVLYQTDPQYQSQWPELKVMMEQNYQNLQNQSTEVLAEYALQGSLPLAPAKPPLPPVASPTINAPDPGGDDSDDDTLPEDGETPDDVEDVEDEWPYDDPAAGSGSPSTATSDLPSDAALTDPLTTAPPTMVPGLSTGGGVKPASFGGGGGALGGGGIPSMPLQPAVGPESATSAGTASPAAAQAGAGAGARAPMGAGGMGMPMGGQGAQNQNSKAKKTQQDDQALYVEDRPWTASIIGNRRRNDTPE